VLLEGGADGGILWHLDGAVVLVQPERAAPSRLSAAQLVAASLKRART
jgi:hypothetical protein